MLLWKLLDARFSTGKGTFLHGKPTVPCLEVRDCFQCPYWWSTSGQAGIICSFGLRIEEEEMK